MSGTNVGSVFMDMRLSGQKGFQQSIQREGGIAEKSMGSAFGKIAKLAAAAFSVAAVVNFGKETVNQASLMQSALLGLNSILSAQGKDFQRAKGFIDSYTKDGLIPASNAITAYKNLAARGYNDSQIQMTLDRLKESAAFGRAAAYSYGDAIQSATEGLKNENSILVDNAGVTKNVAKMWDEYAKSIGKTSNKLTMQEKIQAEVLGIQKETAFQVGDSAKYSDTYAGKVAKLSASFLSLKQSIGNMIMPIITMVIPYIQAAINAVSKLFSSMSNAFGIKSSGALNNAAGSMTDIGIGAENASDKIAGIGDSAKKARKGLLAFDEINSLSKDSDSSAADISAGIPQSMNVPVNIDDSGSIDMFRKKLSGLGDFFKKSLGFSIVSQAFSEFMTKNGTKIRSWMTEVSSNMSGAFKNIKNIIGNIGTEAYKSFSRNSKKISGSVSTLMTGISDNFMTVTKISSDIWNDVSGIFASWTTTNKEEIGTFFDTIIDLWTNGFSIIGTVTSEAANIMEKNWNNHFRNIVQGAARFVTDVGGWFLKLYNNFIAPIVTSIMEWFRKIWNENLKGVVDEVIGFVGRIGELLIGLYEKVLKPIINWIMNSLVPPISQVIKSLIGIIGSFFNAISGIIKGIMRILNGLIDFFTGIFTGNWKKAWEGLKRIVQGVWDVIWNTVKGFVNMIIGALNTLWTGVYTVVKGIVDAIGGIAGALGSLFGQDWKFSMPQNAPTIPYLAQGGIVSQPTLAMIGESGSEAVVPLENNTEWLNKLAAMLFNLLSEYGIGGQGGSALAQTLTAVFNIDGKEMARVLLPLLNQEKGRVTANLKISTTGV